MKAQQESCGLRDHFQCLWFNVKVLKNMTDQKSAIECLDSMICAAEWCIQSLDADVIDVASIELSSFPPEPTAYAS